MTDAEDLESILNDGLGPINEIPEGWEVIWKQEQQKKYFTELISFVESEYNDPDIKIRDIFPPKNMVFRAFRLCKPNDIKVVIIGQDPYHEKNQADGLAFSYSEKGPNSKIPPSLRNILKEFAGDNDSLKNADLSDWANKGVLLLNSILTVREGKALSHENKGWEIFTGQVINFLSKNRFGISFLLWGKYAQDKIKYIEEGRAHNIICTSHPSPLSAKKKCGSYPPFIGSGCFQLLKNEGINLLDYAEI